MAKILVIDDDKAIRDSIRDTLQYEGYDVDVAEDGVAGMVKIKTSAFDLVLSDIRMPKMDGKQFLEQALKLKPELPIIILSAFADNEEAVEIVKKGAFDFISKPFKDRNRLLITVRNALDKSNLVGQTIALKRKVFRVQEIVGKSAAIQDINDLIDRVAETESSVLITGENGTGKELVARWIHEKSRRCNGPFVAVNCAAISPELIESELFGHEKGAFTNAIRQHLGKFEQANGGTLFLDEIGDMSPSAQTKVLRALQDRAITRVGGSKDIEVNVRFLAATNQNLQDAVAGNLFRLDLYHRLNTINIHVPALRERREDIPILAEYFITEICNDQNLPPKSFEPEAITALQNHNWTGNVRELRNMVERLIILSANKVITLADFEKYVSRPSLSNNIAQFSEELFEQFATLSDFRDHAEKLFIAHKLKKNNGNISKTAEELDIQRSHLYNKMDKYNLK
ncbi:MAG TPA: sigma-54 dependent transcriptional regulator [Chitinophagales bacterium]|nr:sigma-54 dependent transcriptional regulator [Chitinophagales bacterium]